MAVKPLSNQGLRGVRQMLTKFRVDGSQTLIKSGIERGETNVDKRDICLTPFKDGEYRIQGVGNAGGMSYE
jgi:hypothetical protein